MVLLSEASMYVPCFHVFLSLNTSDWAVTRATKMVSGFIESQQTIKLHFLTYVKYHHRNSVYDHIQKVY